MELENEVQTPVTPLNLQGTYTPPPLPPMDDPEVYIRHQDVMTTSTRRNYTRDRMRAAITYINEYKDTQDQLEKNTSHSEVLGVRLRIIFGQVNNIRERIDAALNIDDAYRCRRNMRDVPEVKRFPSPQMMGQATATAWVTWIHNETNAAMMMLDEEVAREGDPEDPFNGTAGGVFQMPPGRQNSLTLPPPVRTPVSTGNRNTSQHRQVEGDEHSSHSQATQDLFQRIDPSQQQVENGNGSPPLRGEGDEHSTPPPDPNHTIRELHNQQRQNRLNQSSQEQNLITFTPTPTSSSRDRSPNEAEVDVVEPRQPSATGDEESLTQQTPQPQRTPRTQDRQDAVGQAQIEVNNIAQEGTDEIPREIQQLAPPDPTGDSNVNEQTQNQHDSSYLRLPVPQGGAKERICWRCGELGHSKRACNRQVSCTFCQAYSHATKACKKYASFVRNSQGTSNKKTTPVQNYPQGNQHWINQAYPPHVQGKYRFATGNLPRFQPPVVPPLTQPPPYGSQNVPKKKQKSQQDVRDDPRFNEQPQPTVSNKTQQSTMQNPGTYVKYPIPIETIQNQDNVKPVQQTQTQQVEKSQHQQHTKKGPKQSTSYNVQEELYLQLIQQQQEQLKSLQEQNQMLKQQQWQQQITELQNNSQMNEKKNVQYRGTQVTNGILRPKKEETSVQNEVSQLVNEVDRPVFVNHYYAHLKDSEISLPTKAKLVYIIEGDEHSSPPAKGIQIPATAVTKKQSTKEGDEHSTPSPHTVATGKNRVREAEKVAACGTQATLLQKTGAYATSQEPVVVQPVIGLNNNQPRELHSNTLPDLPDVS